MFKRLDLRLPFTGHGAGLNLTMGGPNQPAADPQQPAPRPHLTDLFRLPLRDRDGRLLMVVEAPAGSRLKLKYDPRLGAFAIVRPMVLGLAYPFDWGFLPSTRAGDGRPVPCMVLADSPTHPGVVVACRPIGVARYSHEGSAQRGDRVLAVPAESGRWAELQDARKLPTALREEIEGFFACALMLEDKGLRFDGWDGPKAAEQLIRDGSVAATAADAAS